MKFIVPFASLLLLVSCTDDQPEPVTPTEPSKRDSTGVLRKENVHPYASIDLSPMDISYFPVDYPVGRMSGSITEPPVARVIYSRPRRQGREVFGKLLPYGQPWRLGANEATEIEFYRPVTIQDKKVNKGRYILYCVPEEKNWQVIFNTNTESWGLRQDSTKDVYKFRIPVQPTPQPIEYFTMVFEESKEGANLVMSWDKVAAALPIRVAP